MLETHQKTCLWFYYLFLAMASAKEPIPIIIAKTLPEYEDMDSGRSVCFDNPEGTSFYTPHNYCIFEASSDSIEPPPHVNLRIEIGHSEENDPTDNPAEYSFTWNRDAQTVESDENCDQRVQEYANYLVGILGSNNRVMQILWGEFGEEVNDTDVIYAVPFYKFEPHLTKAAVADGTV